MTTTRLARSRAPVHVYHRSELPPPYGATDPPCRCGLPATHPAHDLPDTPAQADARRTVDPGDD